MASNPYTSNEILGSCVAILRAHGAENVSHRHGAKHIKLTARYRGLTIHTIVPTTPSDWRSERNAIADLKRRLRAVDSNAM